MIVPCYETSWVITSVTYFAPRFGAGEAGVDLEDGGETRVAGVHASSWIAQLAGPLTGSPR